MYVREKALTFADLSKAVQRSAGLSGLGQDNFDPTDPSYLAESASSLPPSAGSAAVENFLLTGTTASSGDGTNASVMPWGTLALIAGGLIVFSMVVGKK